MTKEIDMTKQPTQISASRLLASHLQMIDAEARRRMEEAINSEAETRGISLEDYGFDAQRMAFTPRAEQT